MLWLWRLLFRLCLQLGRLCQLRLALLLQLSKPLLLLQKLLQLQLLLLLHGGTGSAALELEPQVPLVSARRRNVSMRQLPRMCGCNSR